MSIGVRRLLAALLLSAGTLASAAPPDLDEPPPAAGPEFTETLATVQTLNLLRAGGLSLYLRHGPTDNTHADRIGGVDLADCSTQRQLSDEGRRVSQAVGEAIRRARIPVTEIHASPLCRTRDTARLALPGREYQVEPLLMYSGNLTDAQKAPVLARTRELLATPVPPGSNRLIVAHGPNLMDLTGYYPREATLVIFRPRGDGNFDYLASIPPGLWPALLH